MKRGRPVKSKVRNNIESILDVCGAAYGYEIYKVYRGTFEPTSLRNVYYHLKKGVDEGIFVNVGSETVKGSYTWGENSERQLYVLGHNASNKGSDSISEAMAQIGVKSRAPGKYINWDSLSKGVWKRFEGRLEGIEDKYEKRGAMEEYGRIRVWMGNKDKSGLRKNVEMELNKIIG